MLPSSMTPVKWVLWFLLRRGLSPVLWMIIRGADDKPERVVRRKDDKVLETYHKEENSTEIKAIVGNRFIVSAETENIDVEETWKHGN